MAVAPLPMTSTRRPATGSPSGHAWGCTTSPAKSPCPGKSTTCPDAYEK